MIAAPYGKESPGMTPVAPVSATSSLPVTTPSVPPPKSGTATGAGASDDSDTPATSVTAPKDSGKTSGINVLA
jgi:hypothetical protein